MTVFACVYVCAPHVYQVPRTQKTTCHPSKLELYTGETTMWTLRIQAPLQRAASALKCGTGPSAPILFSVCTKV